MRALVARDVAPHAAAVDETKTYPWEAIRAARGAGLFGANLPREYGGQGRDLLSWYILMEEAAAGCATFANVLAETWMCACLVELAGSEAPGGSGPRFGPR